MKATREAFGNHLPVMGDKYDEIVALDADLGKATKIASFKEKHPDRFFQMGIAEANMIGVASGLSEYGYKVFLASFGSFLTGRYDQIRCSLAYSNRPVVMVGTHVGMAIGKDGVTQMGLEDVSIMRALPNMSILNPASFSEAVRVIEYLCETDLQSPHYLRLGRQPVEDIEMPFEFGKGQIVKDNENEYVDCTIISTGCILGDVLKATEFVEKNSPHLIRVVNMPTLKPIDEEMILHCAEWSKILVTVEDHTVVGGLGSAVSDVIAEHSHMPPLYKIGLNDIFPESAPPEDLYNKYGLSAGEIAKQVLDGLVDK